jgi:hypothetical protein
MPSRSQIVPILLAVVAVLALPVAYAASEGPAVWLARHELIKSQSVQRAYRPLMLLDKTSPRLAYLHYTYLDLWQPKPTVCGPGPQKP